MLLYLFIETDDDSSKTADASTCLVRSNLASTYTYQWSTPDASGATPQKTTELIYEQWCCLHWMRLGATTLSLESPTVNRRLVLFMTYNWHKISNDCQRSLCPASVDSCCSAVRSDTRAVAPGVDTILERHKRGAIDQSIKGHMGYITTLTQFPTSSIVRIYQRLAETETSPLFSPHQAGHNSSCVL